MDPELDDDKEGQAAEPSLEDQLAGAIGATEEEAAITPDPAEPDAQADASAVTPEAAAVKPAEAAKPADAEMYAPLPEHNPRKTHERFAKLVEGHKEISQKYEAAEAKTQEYEKRIGEYEQSLDYLRELGFTTQEAAADLQQFAQYRNALSSGNVDAAVQVLQQQIRQLTLATGRRIEVNPLEPFQDLNQRHQNGELDEATALELARSRHVQQLQHQNQQRQQQAFQHQEQQNEVVHAAVRSVNQVATELQRDPDYARIEPELLKLLPEIKANYAPSQWAREVKRAYETESRVLRLQAQQQAARAPQPLRGNGHAGGQAAPTSMSDAVLQSMGLF